MNIREISDIFKDTADNITAIKSYNFGWASDRVRQTNTEDFQELNEFPRVFFAVPTITGSDQTRKQDTYQVTLFFDDLLGYDNEGDEDPTLQIDKWANLQQYANYFVQRLNKIKQSILPNYLFIPEAPSITFDSFTGIQRMITVQLSFNLVVPTNCDPGIITLVQCIANIVTSSNLTSSLTTVLKFAASLEGRATLTADINFVQKVQASLLTSANVTGDISIPKLLNASLLATGTTTADLTVQSAASLLLDIYPSAAAAYSLRKLRTAYTGSAIRVRRSSDNTEQDIGFTGNDLNTSALTTFCGAGNGFVTTWYDQSGNGRDAIQTVQANQPQIVSSGTVINETFIGATNPTLRFTTQNTLNFSNNIANNVGNIFIKTVSSITGGDAYRSLIEISTNILQARAAIYGRSTTNLEAGGRRLDSNSYQFVNSSIVANKGLFGAFFDYINAQLYVYVNNNSNQRSGGFQTAGNTSNTDSFKNSIGNTVASLTFQGNISEIIIYTTNQSANNTGINNNINTHYAIY